jgi:hypothetical protein
MIIQNYKHATCLGRNNSLRFQDYRKHLQHNLSAYRPQQNITVRMMYIKVSQNKTHKLDLTQLNKQKTNPTYVKVLASLCVLPPHQLFDAS